MTRRFRLTVEYDGGDYCGWQAQADLPTIQTAIEQAVHAFSGETVTLHGSGRTDAGVHALGQVAHFDLEKDLTTDKVQGALNHFLRLQPITILDVTAVDDQFHSRYSATRRHYLYRILNRRAPAALRRGHVWHVARPLDPARMNAAAQVLVGHHDFTTFRAVQCQAKSPMKTLDMLTVGVEGDEIVLRATARSFLHHQIRSITGCLKLVGEGKWTKADLRAALAAKDRTRLGLNAPPDGLYLTEIEYDQQEGQ